MLNKRAHILFDQQLWNQISQLAKEKNISTGQLVRSAVEEKYAIDKRLAKRRKAVEEILALKKQHKKKSKHKKEDVVTLVRRMREEKTQHIWDLLEGRGQK